MVRVTDTKLDNGLEVVAVEQPHLHSACVSLFVNCGSRHERLFEWGLSHLVEHMLFRGSERFPDAGKLARAFERHGGPLQASTWRDHTRLSASIHPARLGDALTALGDMVEKPLFGELEVERRIVEEELLQDVDEDGRDNDINNVSRASIWQGHPMGRRIAGSFESVRAFDVDDVRRHHREHYVGNNAVLCVAGRVDPDEATDLAAEAFGELPAGRRVSNGDVARFSADGPVTVHRRRGTQLAVQLTFGALPDGHPDFAALNLLCRILDDGHSSRLHQALCEKRGLVYELSTGLDCYADCGLYDIEMLVAPRRAPLAIAVTLEAIVELCHRGISDEEVELVRERSINEIEFSIDSCEDLSALHGGQALLGRTEPLASQISRLEAVTRSDLERVARSVFMNGRAHTTLMGPVDRTNVKRIERLLRDFPPSTQSGISDQSSERAVV